jgi:hypothetical protein
VGDGRGLQRRGVTSAAVLLFTIVVPVATAPAASAMGGVGGSASAGSFGFVQKLKP